MINTSCKFAIKYFMISFIFQASTSMNWWTLLQRNFMKNPEFSNFLLVTVFLSWQDNFHQFSVFTRSRFNHILISFFFFPLQIVDSIMALFRVDFSGRGELADRQQKLAQMLSRLQKIAEGSIHLTNRK